MQSRLRKALCHLSLPAMGLCLLVGCQAERAALSPAEPVWSYHDGNTQLSNNDAWEQMLPKTALITAESQVASVEEPSR